MELTEQQILLAELIADPSQDASKAEVCKVAGVSRSTFYRWLKDVPAFGEEIDKAIEFYRRTMRAKALAKLNGMMDHIDPTVCLKAIELAGKYNDDIGSGGTNVVTNVTQTQSDDFTDRVERWTREREPAKEKNS